jgi:hypothetical protein
MDDKSPKPAGDPAPQLRPIVIGGEKERKAKRGRKDILKKEQWYKMVAMFDSDAKAVMQVGGENILLCGWVPPDMDCAIVLVPTSITQEQGLAIEKIIEANLRKPVLVLSQNTQLVRLKPISDGLAEKIMKGEADGHDKILQISQAEAGPREAVEGEGVGVREEDSSGDEGDLRSPEASEGDGGVHGEQAEALGGTSDAAEGEQGPKE